MTRNRSCSPICTAINDIACGQDVASISLAVSASVRGKMLSAGLIGTKFASETQGTRI
jgi:hypothetical protein